MQPGFAWAGFHQLIQKTLPYVRQDYPDVQMVGKLLDEAFLVINLDSGRYCAVSAADARPVREARINAPV